MSHYFLDNSDILMCTSQPNSISGTSISRGLAQFDAVDDNDDDEYSRIYLKADRSDEDSARHKGER